MNVSSGEEMMQLGEKFAGKILSGKNKNVTVIELVGDVGAGKTTFVQGLAKGLGVKELVTSPSFTISKVYALDSGGQLVHYDFYRLPEPGLMAEDLADKMLDPKNIIIIEWGESVVEMLPDERLTIKIGYNEDGARTLKCDTIVL